MLRPRLSTSIAALSLLLLILTTLTWLRSQRWADTLGWAGWKDKPAGLWHAIGLTTENGDLVVHLFSGTWKLDDPRHVGLSDESMQPHLLHQASPARKTPFRWDIVFYNQKKAFRWDTHHLGGNGVSEYVDFQFIGVPLWLPMLLFAIPPLSRLIPLIHRRWKKPPIGFEITSAAPLTAHDVVTAPILTHQTKSPTSPISPASPPAHC